MNTSLENDSLVQTINDEKVKVLRPAIVYIAVMMTSGLVGNLMVCFFYGFKTKTVPSTFFIVTLAIYDLVFSSVCMPFEMVDIVQFYTFKNGTACKILRFINYIAGIASALTLVTIASDRYKHIRRATGKQMTVGDAKKYCILVAGVSVLMSLPAIFIFDSEQIPVSNKYGVDLKGNDCTFVESKSYKPYVLAYIVIIFLNVFVCIIVLTVLYTMMAWTIYKHKKRLARNRLNLLQMSEIQLSSTNNDTKLGASEEADHDLERNTTIEVTTEMGTQAINTLSKSKYPKTDVISPGAFDKIHYDTIRVTLVMLAVTSVFVISNLPFLSLLIWRSLTGKHEGELSNAELVGFIIGSRSFLLNSSTNPWIYGIFNSRFRLYYYKLLNVRCCNSFNGIWRSREISTVQSTLETTNSLNPNTSETTNTFSSPGKTPI